MINNRQLLKSLSALPMQATGLTRIFERSPPSLPPIASIRDAAKELGEPDPTTCDQQGSKGEHVITPDNAREIGKACRGILARRNQVRESKQTSQNLRSALSGISRTADSSPKKKMLITNLPEIFE